MTTRVGAGRWFALRRVCSAGDALGALCGAMRVAHTGVARVGMVAVGRVVQNASGFRRVWAAPHRDDPKSV